MSVRTASNSTVARASFERLEERCLLSAGGLDSSFGTNGYVLTSIHAAAGANGFDGSDLAVAATDTITGRLFVAGSADSNSTLALVRYNTNGSRDISFGQGGQAVLDFGGGSLAMANSVAVQANLGILVGGTATAQSDNLNAVIVRWTTSGQLDTTFGQNGIVDAEVDSTTYDYSAVTKLAVEPDGGIVAAGRAGNTDETNEDWIVWKLTSDGQPDASFGTNGAVTIDLGGMDEPQDMALMPDGKILVAGTSQQASQSDAPLAHTGFWLARLTSDGVLDPTFGTGGILQEEFSQPTFASRIALGSDGSILVAGPIIPAGATPTTTPKVVVSRITSDGATDLSFGTNGWTTTGGISTVLGLKVANDNSAILAGFAPVLTATGSVSATATLFAHYQSNGKPDTRFAANGVVSIRHNISAQLNRNAIFQPDGSVVLVGAGKTYSQQGKIVYGFLSARFKPDRADSKSGSITTVTPSPQIKAMIATGGVLYFKGTNEADTILLASVPGQPLSVRVVVNSVAKIFSLRGIRGIRIDALAGNDYVSLGDVKLPCEVHGGNGDDTLIGGAGSSRLLGEGGNDLLCAGNGGRDTLIGGAGDDVFRAGRYGGVADGGTGRDRIDHSTNSYRFAQTTSIEQR